MHVKHTPWQPHQLWASPDRSGNPNPASQGHRAKKLESLDLSTDSKSLLNSITTSPCPACKSRNHLSPARCVNKAWPGGSCLKPQVLRTLRWEDLELEASLGNTASFSGAHGENPPMAPLHSPPASLFIQSSLHLFAVNWPWGAWKSLRSFSAEGFRQPLLV